MQKTFSSRHFSRKELANWFYYYKWWVVLWAAVLLFGISTLVRVVTQVKPDYQIAYVGEAALPADTVRALETALSALGEDLNGDGQVVVRVNMYPILSESTGAEAARLRTGFESKLVSDILTGESYFFLLEDPDVFQYRYSTLAAPDGSIPEETDTEGMTKTVLWADCSLLTALELGNYQETVQGTVYVGTNQEVLSPLYLGRRFYTQGHQPRNLAGYEAMWERITAHK